MPRDYDALVRKLKRKKRPPRNPHALAHFLRKRGKE
mgnify:CR=1 FL=1